MKKHNKIKLGFLIITMTVFLNTGINAQVIHSSVNSAGGSALGDGGSVNYSVGQIVYSYYNSKDTSLAEGVQQPYEISILTDIKISKNNEDNSLVAFPNPVNDNLTISINYYNFTNLSFQITDLNGKIYKTGDIISNETKVSMENMSKMVYFINIINDNKIIKVFKIIKL